MATDAALVSQCPHCRSRDRIGPAAQVSQTSDEAAAAGADLALPAYEYWSLMLVGSIGLAMLSAMSISLDSRSAGGGLIYLGVVLMASAGALGVVGVWRTWRNLVRMRAVEPSVRRYHASALRCEDCGFLHFPTGTAPPGFEPQRAWTFFEYRKELWYACGFAKIRWFW